MTDDTLPPGVSVGPGRMDEAERVADLWVDLARDQRRHGSHLRAAANRSAVLDSIRRHVVAGRLLVARARPGDVDADGERRGSANENENENANETESGEPTVVGFITFGYESGTYQQSVDRGVVENIFVTRSRRGRGVGSALLRTAEETLAENGADVVSLDVMADNAGARRFYRRHGYDPHRVTMERPARSDTHTSPDD